MKLIITGNHVSSPILQMTQFLAKSLHKTNKTVRLLSGLLLNYVATECKSFPGCWVCSNSSVCEKCQFPGRDGPDFNGRATCSRESSFFYYYSSLYLLFSRPLHICFTLNNFCVTVKVAPPA